MGAGPVNNTTQTELQALFDIIGTPHWADVEAISSGPWKKYLQRLPGKAPTLFRCCLANMNPKPYVFGVFGKCMVQSRAVKGTAGQAQCSSRVQLSAVVIAMQVWRSLCGSVRCIVQLHTYVEEIGLRLTSTLRSLLHCETAQTVIPMLVRNSRLACCRKPRKYWLQHQT